MLNTYARPVRDLRNNYKEIINQANEGNHIIITQYGREAAVVIGTQAFRDYENYLYKQFIKQELSVAKEKALNPDAKWLSEDEFWEGNEFFK